MRIYTEKFHKDYLVNYDRVLRWFKTDENTIEASIIEDSKNKKLELIKNIGSNEKFTVVHIVPTGVQANYGGYIADATPVTNVMAEIADTVVTHPNVLNGAYLNYGANNVLYVEGYSLDNFLNGKMALRPIKGQNKIGVILDKAGFEQDGNLAINTIESLRAILGINVVGYEVTDEPVGGIAKKMPSGAFSGEIKNPQTLINAGRKLINNGANTLAISTFIDMKMEDLNDYFAGKCANPMGGTEALISHLLVREFEIPCAHAPIISDEEKKLYISKGIVDPRAASEVVSPGYLGCILKGLNKAPQLKTKEFVGYHDITVNNVDVIVMPYTCCGGIPAFAAQARDIPIITVLNNNTILNVTPEMMGLDNVIVANNYLEVFGILSSMKTGVSLDSVRRPLRNL